MSTAISVRLCPRCGGDGPFYEGHTTQCKPCRQQMTRDYRKRNPEAKREQDRTYYHANREKYAELRRQNFLANKERDLARMAEWRKANPDGHRETEARRRALKQENGTYPYKRQDIYDRDNGVCQLCGEDIDLSVLWPEDGFFSIDHIIPITKGGSDTPENVQASHLRCNIRKGNKE